MRVLKILQVKHTEQCSYQLNKGEEKKIMHTVPFHPELGTMTDLFFH